MKIASKRFLEILDIFGRLEIFGKIHENFFGNFGKVGNFWKNS
jgi:hypothetical protein